MLPGVTMLIADPHDRRDVAGGANPASQLGRDRRTEHGVRGHDDVNAARARSSHAVSRMPDCRRNVLLRSCGIAVNGHARSIDWARFCRRALVSRQRITPA